MKKSILIVIATCFAAIGQAQDFKQWKLALHVDPNLSWIKPNSKNIEGGDTKFKFGFGIMVDKMFTENYAFSTGMNISSAGGQLTYLYHGGYKKEGQSSNTEIVAERTRTYNLKYLEIPLTLKMRTNEIGYITYWAQFGLGLGFNINAKGDDNMKYTLERYSIADDPDTPLVDETANGWKQSDIKTRLNEDEDIRDDIGLFRTSLIIAGGIEYNLSGNASIVAGITYNNGFNNILKNEGVVIDDASNPSFTNLKPDKYKLKGMSNMLSLTVGILF